MIQQALGIIEFAFSRMLGRRDFLLKSLVFPLLIWALVTAVLIIVPGKGWSSIWFYLFLGYAHLLIAINTHRVMLLANQDLPEWGVRALGKREFKFAFNAIGISFACILPSMFIFIPYVGWIFAVVGMAYIVARLSLVLPATAIDQGWTFARAWHVSQPHQLLLVILLTGFPILIGLVEILISHIPYSNAVLYLFSMFTTVLLVAVLSIVYEEINEGGTT